MSDRPDFQMKVVGLDGLAHLEETIGTAEHRFVSGVAEAIAGELADASPVGATHRLAESWKGRAISGNEAIVYTDNPYAKARDRGAYIVGHDGQAVRFANSFGATVFARFVRQKGTHYVRRGLAKRRVIAEAVFADEFNELRTKA